MEPTILTAFSWGYYGWGNSVPQFLEAVAAAEASRGFDAPVFADVRLRRSVRAPGFNGAAFEKIVSPERYRWFSGLGNARIETGEPGVKIANPPDAYRLLDFVCEQEPRKRRVLFFCSCATWQSPLCHRHEVAGLLVQAAAARGVALAVSEWPGGEPETRELRLTPAQAGRASGATIPLGRKLPSAGLATLPWGSTLLVRIGGEVVPTLTGPASFAREWRLPKIACAEEGDLTGQTLQEKAREFRVEFSCGPRYSR